MLISIWWLIPVLAIGVYAGILLMAVMNVASRRAPHPGEPLLADDSRLPIFVAALVDEAFARKNRERRKRKTGESKRHTMDPMANQGHFQW